MSTKTKSQRQQLPPHNQRRRNTKHVNHPPHDVKRREVERKATNCQRCHYPFKTQYSVVKDEKGNREIVRAQANRAHYCADCAKERQAELERFDARPKTKPKTAKKSGGSGGSGGRGGRSGGGAKRKTAARAKREAKAKVTKKAAAAKPAADKKTEADPF